MVGCLARNMSADEGSSPDDAVRSRDPLIRAWVQDGRQRSKTFRDLADGIEPLHGVVYLDAVTHIRNGLNGALLYSVTATTECRYFRVLINVRTRKDLAIVTIGHELQHVIEALQDPRVTSERAMRERFDRLKITGSVTNRPAGEYETEAAVAVGTRIAKELAERSRN
jgi:hypothetical protein